MVKKCKSEFCTHHYNKLVTNENFVLILSDFASLRGIRFSQSRQVAEIIKLSNKETLTTI